MSLNYNEIGKNIREVRKENGLSQAMLSELVEKSPSYISYIHLCRSGCGALDGVGIDFGGGGRIRMA